MRLVNCIESETVSVATAGATNMNQPPHTAADKLDLVIRSGSSLVLAWFLAYIGTGLYKGAIVWDGPAFFAAALLLESFIFSISALSSHVEELQLLYHMLCLTSITFSPACLVLGAISLFRGVPVVPWLSTLVIAIGTLCLAHALIKLAYDAPQQSQLPRLFQVVMIAFLVFLCGYTWLYTSFSPLGRAGKSAVAKGLGARLILAGIMALIAKMALPKYVKGPVRTTLFDRFITAMGFYFFSVAARTISEPF